MANGECGHELTTMREGVLIREFSAENDDLASHFRNSAFGNLYRLCEIFYRFLHKNQLPKYGVKVVTRPGGGSIHAGGAGTREHLHATNATNPLQSGDPPDIISLSANDTRNWYLDGSKAITTLQEMLIFMSRWKARVGDGSQQSRDQYHCVANVCDRS